MPGWHFDGYRDECAALWDAELSKVSVSGGTDEERRVFYTALYHTLLDPRLCSDVNGEYLGADNKVHQTAAFNKRTIFSGWDVFRSQMPLQTIINPTVVNDMLNSLIEIASQTATNTWNAGNCLTPTRLHARQSGHIGALRRILERHPRIRR